MMRALIIRIMQLCTLLACGAAWAQTRLTTVDDLKELVARFKSLVKQRTGNEFPANPWEQLKGAVGAVFVPVNPVLKAEQVAHILNDCDVRVLVTSGARLQTLTEVLPSACMYSCGVPFRTGKVP